MFKEPLKPPQARPRLNCSLAERERGQLWQPDSHRKTEGRPMTSELSQPAREHDNGIRLSRRDERFIRRTGTGVTACNEVVSGRRRR